MRKTISTLLSVYILCLGVTAQNVGVGTSTPAQKLDVAGIGADTVLSATSGFYFSGTGGLSPFSGSTVPFATMTINNTAGTPTYSSRKKCSSFAKIGCGGSVNGSGGAQSGSAGRIIIYY